jgi:hypothetical protein
LLLLFRKEGLPSTLSALEKSMFFSEEKNQKTFIPALAASSRPSPPMESCGKLKVFCFFSSEKKTFLPY